MANPTPQVQLLPGTRLLEFDTSTKEKTYRLELSAGQQFQINEKLYHLLRCLRLPLTLPELAAAFQQQTGLLIELHELQPLVTRLTGQGVLVTTDTPVAVTTPTAHPADPYLSLQFKRDLFSEMTLAPFTGFLQFFFKPLIVIPTLLLIISVHLWVYTALGFPASLNTATIAWPLLIILLLFSNLLHELGHLSACRYWHCPHGAAGIGLYFFNLVFYADVTPAWRLARWQRVVVDAAGVYFELLLTPFLVLLFGITNDATYLFAIMILNVDLLINFSPLMKLDGYWLISDLTGVPNLHQRTGDLIKRGWHWLLWQLEWRAELPPPSPFSRWSWWVQGVIYLYVLISILAWPWLILMLIPILVQIVTIYPLMWAQALSTLAVAIGNGDSMAVLTELGALFLPTVLLLNLGLFIKIMLNQWYRALRPKQVTATTVVESL